MEQKSLPKWIWGFLAAAVVLLLLGAGLLYVGLVQQNEAETAVTVEPTPDVALIVTQTVGAMSMTMTAQEAAAVTATPGEVAQVVVTVDEPPTATAVPTDVPTETAVPTETPVPPTPTATLAPILPTNTAVPPTNTPAPPTNTPPPPGPQPGNHNGLIATHFALQDWRTNPVPNGEIWYEWTVDNTTTSGVPYSTIGVLPRRNGKDEVRWYQNNYGGNNDVMPPEGLSWPSWMSLPERGDYTLRLVVCFDGFQACLNGSGTFHTLSQEIPITIR